MISETDIKNAAHHGRINTKGVGPGFYEADADDRLMILKAVDCDGEINIWGNDTFSVRDGMDIKTFIIKDD